MRLFYLKNQVANEFIWMYLIIFLIPIVPRLVRRYRRRNSTNPQPYFANSTNQRPYIAQDNPQESQNKTDDMRVIDELNRGPTTFEKIQKNTGIDSKDLNVILEDLEKGGLMKVIHKQGLFGPKIELHANKNFRVRY